MKVKLCRWDNGEIIFEREVGSMRELLEVAIRERINLEYANLVNANLVNANLENAKLENADLRYSNLEYSDLANADLRYSNVEYSNLRYSNLANANLEYSNLRYSNLANANLANADLENAKLGNAYLEKANLEKANLENTNLRYAIGNMKEIRSMQVERYHIVYTSKMLCIGCMQYPIEEWENFSDDQIRKMDKGALDFWKKWKEFIFLAIELSFGKIKKGD